MESMAEVYDRYREDPAFAHLRRPDRPLIGGEGPIRPKVFIVGEAPGATENVKQRPFVGASGEVLRSLITDVAGLQPKEYWITNVVKYWPGPGNPTPDFRTQLFSVPYLRDEWKALGGPKVIVAVGGVAKSVLCGDVPGGVLATSGGCYLGSGGTSRWIMIHPSYGLRREEIRPKMEKDWEFFGEWFKEEYR